MTEREPQTRAFVINLDEGSARMTAIRTLLATLDIETVRVAAFDGRNLDPRDHAGYDSGRAERYMGRSLVGGEIGCYLSHLAAARRFLETDCPHGIVLEDDARPLCRLGELLGDILPDLSRIDPDWRLINIGNNRHKIATPLRQVRCGAYEGTLFAAHYFPMTTSGLVWSRAGAQAFIDRHDTIFAPVDNYLRHWMTREGHGYSLWPAPVSVTGAESQILGADNQARRLQGRSWSYGLAKKKRMWTDQILALGAKARFPCP